MMAMLRSASGRVSRRLSGNSGAPLVMNRRWTEMLQAQPLSSLCSSAPWMPRPGSAAAAVARTRRIANLQGRQHFPVISKGTEGMEWAEQTRFLCTERKANGAKLMEFGRRAVKKFKEEDLPYSSRHEFTVVVFVSVVYCAWMTVDLLGIRDQIKHAILGKKFYSGKCDVNDACGEDDKHA
ncbi:hypothetical protein ACP70R_026385 [Stipagrostis hirtigluma subsp. patula]